MRLCFYNPHAIINATGETVVSRLAQFFGTNKKKLRKHVQKYSFLLNILRNKKYKTAIIVDGAETSFGAVLNRILLLKNNQFIYCAISFVEIYIWCLLNKINPLKQTIIFNKKRLRIDEDILFGFAFCSELFLNEQLLSKSIMKSFNGLKILHASHFYKFTKRVAENVHKAGIKYMVAETDLKKSPYFNKFFGFIEKVYILPHVLREKYIKITDFANRKNICLALGTLVIESAQDKSNQDYLEFFKIDTLHPMRKIIFENKDNLPQIDCCINLHNKDRMVISQKSKWYNKNGFFKLFYDLFFLAEGKEYHSMDIVKKYNEYKMFIAPEENIGLTSINVCEGMACGCAYIGLDSDMYKDMGMIGTQHYIAYDGMFEDLKNKINYYQNHPSELEQIAQNGYVFAHENFAEEKVVADFWTYLEKLIQR
ncbi:MAG: glycosyltransferase [Candidatus Falkowbacteria bacterium]